MEERGKSALRAKEDSRDVPGGRRHLTPPHVNPIWPLQRRTTKKSRSLGRMIRSRMILFQFLHAISPKALEFRLVDDDGEPAWRFCENVLTLRAKTEEEARQKVDRLREVQSAALASRGRRGNSSAQERIDFDVPLSAQSYRRTAVGRRADNRQAGKRAEDEATARRQWAGGRAEGSDDTTALHQWRELRCKPSRDKPKSASKRKSTGSEMKKKQRQVRGEAEMSTNSGKKRDSEAVRLSRQRGTLGRSDGLETSGGDCRRGRGELAHRLSWVGVSAGRDNGGLEGDREDLRSPDRRGTRLEGCGQGKSAAGLKRGIAAPRVGYTGTSGRWGRFSGARSGGKSGLLAAGQRSRQTTSGGTKTSGLELAEGSSAARFSKLHERLVGAADTSTASNKKLVRGVADDADQWMWDRFDSIMMALKRDFSKDGGTYRRTNRARSTRLGASLARILLASGVVGVVATPSQLQGALKNFSSLYFKHGTPDVITLRC